MTPASRCQSARLFLCTPTVLIVPGLQALEVTGELKPWHNNIPCNQTMADAEKALDEVIFANDTVRLGSIN